MAKKTEDSPIPPVTPKLDSRFWTLSRVQVGVNVLLALGIIAVLTIDVMDNRRRNREIAAQAEITRQQVVRDRIEERADRERAEEFRDAAKGLLRVITAEFRHHRQMDRRLHRMLLCAELAAHPEIVDLLRPGMVRRALRICPAVREKLPSESRHSEAGARENGGHDGGHTDRGRTPPRDPPPPPPPPPVCIPNTEICLPGRMLEWMLGVR